MFEKAKLKPYNIYDQYFDLKTLSFYANILCEELHWLTEMTKEELIKILRGLLKAEKADLQQIVAIVRERVENNG